MFLGGGDILPYTDGVWFYSIIGVHDRVTFFLCGEENIRENMDTIIQVFQDSFEVICVGENDDIYSCTNDRSLIVFDAVETEKYIFLVVGYSGSEGTFKLSVECDHPRAIRWTQ